SRPGSSLQAARPATSTGFRTQPPDPEAPLVVNVARGGARVIGPKRAPTDMPQPAYLNAIPQSPSSALGALIPEPSLFSRDHFPSALSSNSDSAHSRANSAMQPPPPSEDNMEAAEARVSRKIQDLEISNQSLLAVNSQLEARVKSQREEISDLKKQIQLKTTFAPDALPDTEISDEALRSALKEDKVFERLISNLDHLIQDAKSALEYRSTIAAGKVISAAELNEDGSQLTVGKNSEQHIDPSNEIETETDDENDDNDNEDEDKDQDKDDEDKDDDAADKPGLPTEPAVSESQDASVDTAADSNNGPEVESPKIQEARELIARLMVLALSSPEPPSPAQFTDKPNSRIPRRTIGGPASSSAAASTSASASAASAARPLSAMKGGLRTPIKAPGTRISSFGVASENSPVRSLVVSPTPSGRVSTGIAEKEQILDICRKLQQIL
ncbi:hypothetical protein LPJ66_010148, partial [Kickxella alabastrina]